MEAQRMEKEALKDRLEDPDFMIIDVRREVTGQKIKNAVIRDPETVDSWMNEFPKDKTLLFYCA